MSDLDPSKSTDGWKQTKRLKFIFPFVQFEQVFEKNEGQENTKKKDTVKTEENQWKYVATASIAVLACLAVQSLLPQKPVPPPQNPVRRRRNLFRGSYSSASSKSAKIVRAVPKADVREDSTGGVQKFRVKLLAETYGQTTTDVLCQDYFPTVFDNFSANVVVDGNTVNLVLWDTAGQEDYNRLRHLSYRGADVFILAFSLITYENIADKWIPELRHYAPGVHIVLVGTKLELRDDKQFFLVHPGAVPITTNQGEELKKLIGSAVYIECSSKTQQNVKAVFEVTMLHLLNFRAKLACVVQAHSKSDSEKLIADLTNLVVSSRISVAHAEAAFIHRKLTHESLEEMNNDQHDAEVDSARTAAAEEDVTKNSDEIIQKIGSMSVDEKASVSQILDEKSLESFQQDHCCQARRIEDKAQETSQQRYTEYEPTGTTPSRSEPEVPSKATIELLRAMPMETLLEEFRENKS